MLLFLICDKIIDWAALPTAPASHLAYIDTPHRTAYRQLDLVV